MIAQPVKYAFRSEFHPQHPPKNTPKLKTFVPVFQIPAGEIEVDKFLEIAG